MNDIVVFENIFIYSPSLDEDHYQELFEYFSKYLLFHIIPNFLNEEDIVVVIIEIVEKKLWIVRFGNRDIWEYRKIKISTRIWWWRNNYARWSEWKKLVASRVQAMFQRNRHNNLSTFLISQNYYELAKGTMRANGNIHHTFTPKKHKDLQNLYRVKASMDMAFNDFKYLTTSCWDKKFQLCTIDIRVRINMQVHREEY